jgi:hypothetical protein
MQGLDKKIYELMRWVQGRKDTERQKGEGKGGDIQFGVGRGPPIAYSDRMGRDRSRGEVKLHANSNAVT